MIGKINLTEKLIELLKTLRPSKESRGCFGSCCDAIFEGVPRDCPGTVSQYPDTFNSETRSRGRKISGRREHLRRKRHVLSHIFAFLGNPCETDWKNEGATNCWRYVNHANIRTTIVPSPFIEESADVALFRSRGDRENQGGRSTFRRIEGDHVRAGSSRLGRLGLGLVALCLVKAVNQRLDNELDRQLVDVLHVLRISVLQCTLHRIQKRFLNFLKVERIWLL